MTKAILFASSANSDLKVDFPAINNLSATTDPGVTDDANDGYEVGSQWVNTTTDKTFTCVDATAGAAAWNQTSSTGDDNAQFAAPAATTPTGTGGSAKLIGGTGGATSGAGGSSELTGGAATGTNSSGGSAVLTGGAKTGTGIAGGVRVESILIKQQAAPTAKTVSATLTAAELLAGIITVAQGAGAPSAQQLPNGTAIQNALPADMAVGDSFDVSVINIGGASEVASLTVNTDVTIVGNAAIPVPATGVQSSGLFRFRKTADHVFVAYRIA